MVVLYHASIPGSREVFFPDVSPSVSGADSSNLGNARRVNNHDSCPGLLVSRMTSSGNTESQCDGHSLVRINFLRMLRTAAKPRAGLLNRTEKKIPPLYPLWGWCFGSSLILRKIKLPLLFALRPDAATGGLFFLGI